MEFNDENIIHTVIDPLLDNPESVLVRVIPHENGKDIDILVATEKEEISRLIGRKGVIANAIREVVSIGAKAEEKRVHIHFESLGEEEEKGE